MSLVEAGGYQRLVAGTPAMLSVTYYDGSVVVDPGSVTVTVTRADGTPLKAAGTAASGTGATARTVSLTTTDTAGLDQLTCVWHSDSQGDVTTYAEIVGGRLFTLAEARSFDKLQLSDTTKYPDAELETQRQRIEDDFQEICGVSFIPRFKYELYDGRGNQMLILRDYHIIRVRSIDVRTIGTTTWTAYSDTDMLDVFIDRHGILKRELGVPFWPAFQNVRIGYEYGYLQVPLPIRRAALKLAVSVMGTIASNLPERATSMQGEFGSYTLATPGMRGASYGLPDVDATLARFNERTRSFA